MINDAYVVEMGDSGLACKTQPRLLVPLGDNLELAYKEGRIIKAVSTDPSDNTIYGVIVYEFTTSTAAITDTPQSTVNTSDSSTKDRVIHYGPLAVNPSAQGKGIGKKLIEFVEGIGKREGARAVKIHVMNVRSDLIPMYERLGYVRVGHEEYPYPERLSRYCFFHLYEKALI